MLQRLALRALVLTACLLISPPGARASVVEGMPDALLQKLEATLDRAVAAYNAEDWQKFYAEFDRRSIGPSDSYKGDRAQYGALKSRKMRVSECRYDPSGRAMLNYDVQAEKGALRMAVRFEKVGSVFKIEVISLDGNPNDDY